MIIPGYKIKEGGLVKEAVFDSQFQPAGADLTLRAIFRFDGAGEIDGDNSRRALPPSSEIPFPDGGEPLHLLPGSYKMMFNEVVKIPKDCVAMALPRSSLLRMGATTNNALWDPGYEGRSEGLLVVSNPAGLRIHKNAKVIQLVFVRLEGEAASLYRGQYHGENK